MSIQRYKEFILESTQQIGGKALLVTFMKCLTALGQKNNSPALEFTSKDFLVFYDFDKLDVQKVKGIFGRFKSLTHFQHLINYDHSTISLYFGIKCNGTFEYGVRCSEELKPIGNFKLNQSGINTIVRLESLSAGSIKKELVNLSPKDISLMGVIKNEISKFNPGYHGGHMVPLVKDKVLTFGYQGLGRWESGQVNPADVEKLKNSLKIYLSKYRWCDKVLVSVKPEASFWIKIYIKLK